MDLKAVVPLDLVLWDIMTLGQVNLPLQIWVLTREDDKHQFKTWDEKITKACFPVLTKSHLCVLHSVKMKMHMNLPPLRKNPCSTSDCQLIAQTSISSTRGEQTDIIRDSRCRNLHNTFELSGFTFIARIHSTLNITKCTHTHSGSMCLWGRNVGRCSVTKVKDILDLSIPIPDPPYPVSSSTLSWSSANQAVRKIRQ